jgi:hypothetical protein
MATNALQQQAIAFKPYAIDENLSLLAAMSGMGANPAMATAAAIFAGAGAYSQNSHFGPVFHGRLHVELPGMMGKPGIRVPMGGVGVGNLPSQLQMMHHQQWQGTGSVAAVKSLIAAGADRHDAEQQMADIILPDGAYRTTPGAP